jgi:hypothetical protein
MGGSGDAAGRARLQLIRLELRAVTEATELSPLVAALEAMAGKNPAVAADLTQLSATTRGVVAAVDSSLPGSPQGDLRLFLAAEAARDSLQAPRLAEGIFLRIVNEWPDSPYAPKAVLAAQQLNPSWADSARVLLESRYFYSPYLSMIRGEEGAAYRQLEDSLGAFAAAASTAVGRTRSNPAGRRLPNDDDAAGRRRTQPSPTARVPEP